MPGFDIVGAIIGLVLGLVWLVRLEGRITNLSRAANCVDDLRVLEGRVSNHDSLFVERKAQVAEWLDQHEAHDQERHTELKIALTEIKATLAQAPKDIEAATVLAEAKRSAQDVVAAAKVVAQAVVTASDLAKYPIQRKPRFRKKS
jgi:hypothetical protein